MSKQTCICLCCLYSKCNSDSRKCLARKGFTETNWRQDTFQQPRTKIAFFSWWKSADEPVVHLGFRFFVVFKNDSGCLCFRGNIQDSSFDLLKGKREGCLWAGSTQQHPVLPSPAAPGSPAVRRPNPTGLLCVCVLNSGLGSYYIQTCRAWKGFTETRRHWSTGLQPGRKRDSCLVDKPLINPWWTGCQPHLFLHRFQ